MARCDTANSASRHDHDTARRPCNTAGLSVGQAAARVHGLAVGGLLRYKRLYRDKRGRPGVAIQRAKGYDTTQQCHAIRRVRHELYRDINFVSRRGGYDTTGPDAARWCASALGDMAGHGLLHCQMEPRHGAQRARSLGSLGVHPVHPTQF